MPKQIIILINNSFHTTRLPYVLKLEMRKQTGNERNDNPTLFGFNLFCQWTSFLDDCNSKITILLSLKYFAAFILRSLWFTYPFIRLMALFLGIIWDKVFKNGPSKICGRQPLKRFSWSILEYLHWYADSVWFTLFCFCTPLFYCS